MSDTITINDPELAMIRDAMLEKAGGDPEAMFMETVNEHLAASENSRAVVRGGSS